jgi:phage terminase large subunit-like protein
MSSPNLSDAEFHPHIIDVFDYSQFVVSGEKFACEAEQLACNRFLSDIDRDFDYYFDHEKAVRAINFIEKLPHVKGQWAARRQRITLQPWQKFIMANLFGWVHKETGLRRFRKAYICVPRKNGKSVIAAAIAIYMLVADYEHGAEVYCGATTEKQAWEVFRPAKLMVEKSPSLRRTFRMQVNAKSITAWNDSRFEPIIGKPGDGSSPSLAIVDEYHEHVTSDLYDTMDTGMGAREQGLMLVITTAGSNISGPCYELQKDVERVLTGLVDNDEVFGIIYGIDKNDAWTDEQSLIKANPNWGISVGSDFLKAAQKYATQNSSKQNAFKTKHLNVWCWAKSAYFNANKWLECADLTLNINDFKGDDCFIAADLAKIYDISSLAIVFRRIIDGQKHYYVFSRNYLPEDTIASDEHPQLQEIYGRWLNDGHLLIGGDAEMDFRIISDEIIGMKEAEFNIIEVPHDPHFAFLIARDLSEAGLVPVEIKQHGSQLGPGMREIEAAIAAGRIHHDGNPVTNWAIANVLGKEFSNGGLMPDKENKISKIDPAVALIMAVGRAMLGEVENNQPGILDLWADE